MAPMLEAIGVDADAQAVYEALVDGAPGTLEALGRELTMPPGQVRAAADLLLSKGLASRDPGEPARYRAAAPEHALEILFLEQERGLTRGRAYLGTLAERFRSSNGDRGTAQAVETVSGRDAIRRRFEQLQRSTRHQIRGVDRPPYTVAAATLNPIEAELLASGVRYKIIYDPASLEFHPLREDLELSTAQGEEARVLAGTPAKLLIFDDNFAMIPARSAPDEIDELSVVHPSGLLDALIALFEVLWERALPLFPDPGRAKVQPTVDDQRLIALLTAGLTDEAIAKQLGVSYRTLQRRIHDLLHRLEARSRFQAGLRAAQLGWVGSNAPDRPASPPG